MTRTLALCFLVSLFGCSKATDPSNPQAASGMAGKGTDRDPQNGSTDDLAPSGRGPQLEVPDSGAHRSDAGSSKPIELDLANCPDAEPELGQKCEAPPLLCSYGDSMVAGCRNYLECSSKMGVWEQSQIPTKCVRAPDDACPETAPSGMCPSDPTLRGAPCVYPDGTYCYCENAAWSCLAPPVSGCPLVAPNFGDPCGEQGLGCKYGDPCRGGFVTICRANYWQPVGIGCP